MKNVIKFLIFIAYSTCIFFLPNNMLILVFLTINLLAIILTKIHIKTIVKSTIKVIPFILFTFIINCLLDDFKNSLWIGIKLIIVCNITITYSHTTSVTRNSRNSTIIMYSIKNI